jgi:hypothetical protein
MKAILVCPESRPAVGFLGEGSPLTHVPILGKSLLEHWMEFFAASGIKEVQVQAPDRPKKVSELLAGGARWGLNATVVDTSSELKVAGDQSIYYADRLPNPGSADLTESYGGWFRAVRTRLASLDSGYRVGAKELSPGVWAGRGSIISPGAKLIAPCWIGENVRIDTETVIGPGAILEDFVVIERGVEVSESWVGPETFVGTLVRVRESLAWGSTLISWRTGSCISVPDGFLLSSLRNKSGSHPEPKKLVGRLQANLIAWPAHMLASMRGKLRG